MSTTDTVLLIVLASLLSIFTLVAIIIGIVVLKLLGSVKRIVAKAEDTVDSVESAAEVLRDTHGRLALFKLIRNIIKLVQRSRK